MYILRAKCSYKIMFNMKKKNHMAMSSCTIQLGVVFYTPYFFY